MDRRVEEEESDEQKERTFGNETRIKIQGIEINWRPNMQSSYLKALFRSSSSYIFVDIRTTVAVEPFNRRTSGKIMVSAIKLTKYQSIFILESAKNTRA